MRVICVKNGELTWFCNETIIMISQCKGVGLHNVPKYPDDLLILPLGHRSKVNVVLYDCNREKAYSKFG